MFSPMIIKTVCSAVVNKTFSFQLKRVASKKSILILVIYVKIIALFVTFLIEVFYL